MPQNLSNADLKNLSHDDEPYLAFFPVGTIIRDLHHCKSPTRSEQGLNLS